MNIYISFISLILHQPWENQLSLCGDHRARGQSRQASSTWMGGGRRQVRHSWKETSVLWRGESVTRDTDLLTIYVTAGKCTSISCTRNTSHPDPDQQLNIAQGDPENKKKEKSVALEFTVSSFPHSEVKRSALNRMHHVVCPLRTSNLESRYVCHVCLIRNGGQQTEQGDRYISFFFVLLRLSLLTCLLTL